MHVVVPFGSLLECEPPQDTHTSLSASCTAHTHLSIQCILHGSLSGAPQPPSSLCVRIPPYSLCSFSLFPLPLSCSINRLPLVTSTFWLLRSTPGEGFFGTCMGVCDWRKTINILWRNLPAFRLPRFSSGLTSCPSFKWPWLFLLCHS